MTATPTSAPETVATGDAAPEVREMIIIGSGPAGYTAAVYAAHGLSDWNVKPSQAGRWYRALRAGGVTASAEAAYVESRIVAPSGLIPTAQERRQLELAGSPRRGEDGSR